MADSSTEAMPSMTSPSPGIISPAETRTTSPFFSSLERNDRFRCRPPARQAGFGILLGLFQAGSLRLAPALRHRLGKVCEQHRDQQNRCETITIICTQAGYPLSPNSPGNNESSSVMKKPISTTNMTGFFIMYTGIQLFKGADDCLPENLRRHQFLICFLLMYDYPP